MNHNLKRDKKVSFKLPIINEESISPDKFKKRLKRNNINININNIPKGSNNFINIYN